MPEIHLQHQGTLTAVCWNYQEHYNQVDNHTFSKPADSLNSESMSRLLLAKQEHNFGTETREEVFLEITCK